jgi:hypothetical protein
MMTAPFAIAEATRPEETVPFAIVEAAEAGAGAAPQAASKAASAENAPACAPHLRERPVALGASRLQPDHLIIVKAKLLPQSGYHLVEGRAQ